MLIYVDPQSYTNRYIEEIALSALPSNCQVTSDKNDLPKVSIIVAGLNTVDQAMIQKANNVKVIIRNAVGVDNIDVNYAKSKNIPVYNLPDVNYESVAEMTIGYMIAAGRYMIFNHINNLNGIEKNYYRDYQGYELMNKTFGILGFGRIGQRVSQILQQGFNARVLIYDPYVSDAEAKDKQVIKVDDYKDILKEADFVSIHTPLTNETRNMINKDTLKLCKPNCVLVNAARAGIVNEDDLYQALKNHTILACCDDVLENNKDNKLFTLDNFFGTSHICGNSKEARMKVGKDLLSILLREIKKIEE